ncbi:Ig-like domain-containing protein [Gottfriedia luciferensis]|uniref:Ig-like domain-containing protein n=1 Tax=Gottfriedia luciferensis TaxID=178774 RepID=UPI000B4336C0|nr:Ig-like domain-containing protein [Gottfriedia luciferensis]
MKNNSKRIQFKDPAILLREGSSTYYSLEYIDDAGVRTLLDPNEITLESLDNSIVTIDHSNKIIANKTGNTLVKASYQGLTDYISVEVKSKAASQIFVDPLYDSSLTITGHAPGNIHLYALTSQNYNTITNPDGSFKIELEKPLKANSNVNLWYDYDELGLADAPQGADYLTEKVLRDTVAPKPPVITNIDEETYVMQGFTEPNATVSVSANAIQNSVRSGLQQTNAMSSSSSSFSVKPMNAKLFSTKTKLNTTQNTVLKNVITTKADKNGKFKLSIKGLNDTGYVNTTATDLVGNKSKPTVAKLIDKTPPTAPVVNPVSDITTIVTGKAEPYALVNIIKDNKLISSKRVSSNGKYSITIPKQKVGTLLSVTAKDNSNNSSKATIIKVLKAPAMPSINQLTNKSTIITGKAQAYTTVIVKNGSKNIGSTTVNNKGAYSLKIKPQPADSKITVIVRNKYGVTSYPKSISVKDVISPQAPLVSSFTTNSKTISGNSEPYATIKIYKKNSLLASTTVTKSGTWSVKISPQSKNTILTIYSYDKSNNRSVATIKKVN